MGATNHTTNYNLPQFVGSDKPTWLGDVNGAMNLIDSQMKTNNDLGELAKTTADTAQTTATTASTTASTAETKADNAQTTANSALDKATTNEANITLLDNKYASQILYAKPSANISMTNNYNDVNNLSAINVTGSAITIENGKVKIGSGVSKAKILVKYYISSASTTTFYSYIRKNNTDVASTWVVTTKNGGWDLICYNQAIVDVEENDILTFSHYSSAGGQLDGVNTTIIVEKIA